MKKGQIAALILTIFMHNSIANTENDLLEERRKAIEVKTSDENINNYRFNENDDIKTSYFKSVILSKYLYDTWTFESIRYVNCEIEKFYNKFPYSVEIACEYSYVSPYSGRDIFFQLKLLQPFLQESSSFSILSQRIVTIFSNWKYNIDRIIEDDEKDLSVAIPLFFRGSDYKKLLNCETAEDGYEAITNLIKYFSSLIDIHETKLLLNQNVKKISDFNKKIIESKKEINYNVRYNSIKTLASIYRYFQIENEQKIIAKTKKEVEEKIYVDQMLQNKERDKKSETFVQNRINETIKTFKVLEKLPNDFTKIQQTLAFIQNSRKKELSNYDNIPNYEKLKEIFRGSNEADFLNYAFKVFIKKDYQNYLDYFVENPSLDKNIRALKLKLFCMKELKMNLNTQLELVQKIISLDKKDLDIRLYETYLIFTLEDK